MITIIRTFKGAAWKLYVIFLLSFLFLNSYGQYADIPNAPLRWSLEPHSYFSTEIVMEAAEINYAGYVEYRFECFGGHGYSSDWQKSVSFKNSDLMPKTSYSYQVFIRDSETKEEISPPSIIVSVTTRGNTNTEQVRHISEIDKAFKNGEIELTIV